LFVFVGRLKASIHWNHYVIRSLEAFPLQLEANFSLLRTQRWLQSQSFLLHPFRNEFPACSLLMLLKKVKSEAHTT